MSSTTQSQACSSSSSASGSSIIYVDDAALKDLDVEACLSALFEGKLVEEVAPVMTSKPADFRAKVVQTLLRRLDWTNNSASEARGTIVKHYNSFSSMQALFIALVPELLSNTAQVMTDKAIKLRLVMVAGTVRHSMIETAVQAISGGRPSALGSSWGELSLSLLRMARHVMDKTSTTSHSSKDAAHVRSGDTSWSDEALLLGTALLSSMALEIETCLADIDDAGLPRTQRIALASNLKGFVDVVTDYLFLETPHKANAHVSLGNAQAVLALLRSISDSFCHLALRCRRIPDDAMCVKDLRDYFTGETERHGQAKSCPFGHVTKKRFRVDTGGAHAHAHAHTHAHTDGHCSDMCDAADRHFTAKSYGYRTTKSAAGHFFMTGSLFMDRMHQFFSVCLGERRWRDARDISLIKTLATYLKRWMPEQRATSCDLWFLFTQGRRHTTRLDSLQRRADQQAQAAHERAQVQRVARRTKAKQRHNESDLRLYRSSTRLLAAPCTKLRSTQELQPPQVNGDAYTQERRSYSGCTG